MRPPASSCGHCFATCGSLRSIAVNRCDDIDVARRFARSLGALDGESVVPCQLIDPDSGREVVVEILLTLLEAMETTQVEVA